MNGLAIEIWEVKIGKKLDRACLGARASSSRINGDDISFLGAHLKNYNMDPMKPWKGLKNV